MLCVIVVRHVGELTPMLWTVWIAAFDWNPDCRLFFLLTGIARAVNCSSTIFAILAPFNPRRLEITKSSATRV